MPPQLIPVGSPTGTQAVWTKICGLRDEDSARMVARLRPAAIGLNFYPQSSRFVGDDQARAIAREMSPETRVVGVFVNASLEELRERVRTIPLDAVQFHGDETAAEIAAFHRACPETAIIQVIRYGEEGLRPGLQQLRELAELNVPIAACLIDAQVAGSYGGTGAVVPWQRLLDELATATLPPVILAGGLQPDNVAQAIQLVHPHGVDVASGVESAPGVKDPDKVAAFLAACRTA